MKVSIIIPVYNVEHYLKRCLDSVIQQTYTNLEIIIVNDGSPDNSWKICEKYEKMDSRIIYLKQENGGLSSARNTGLKAATGDIILFLDSDDYIHKRLVELVCNAFERYQCDIVEFNLKEVFSMENEEEDSFEEKYEKICKEDAIKSLFDDGKIRFEVWNKAYKKKIIKDLFFIEKQIHEDVYFTTSCLNRIDTPLIYIDIPLYFYYKGRTTNIGNSPIDAHRLDIFNEFIKLHKSKEFSIYQKYIERMICNYLIAFYINGKLYMGFKNQSEKYIDNKFKYYYKNYIRKQKDLPKKQKFKYFIFYISKKLYIFCFKIKKERGMA